MSQDPVDGPVDDLEGSFNGYRKLALAILFRRLDDLNDATRRAQAYRWLVDLLEDEESCWAGWLFVLPGIPRARVKAMMGERSRPRKHVHTIRSRRSPTLTASSSPSASSDWNQKLFPAATQGRQLDLLGLEVVGIVRQQTP